MAIREVLTSFTFEQQRQMINLIGTDIGDTQLLVTPSKVLTTSVNEVVAGYVTLSGQTIRLEDGSLGTPSLSFDSATNLGLYKHDASTIGFNNSLFVNGGLTVNGDITFRAGNGTSGTLTFGDVNTDNIVFNADINSNVIPNTNNFYDLGSLLYRWKDIFIGSTATINTLSVDTNATITGDLAANGGNITSTSNSFNLLSTPITLSGFTSATSLTLGSTTGTLVLRNPNIVGVNTTQNLFNTVATTVNAFGQASEIFMGITLSGVPGNNSNFTIRSDDTILIGDLNVNGGEILSSQDTFDLLINNGDVRIGASTGTGTTIVNNSLKIKGTTLDLSNQSVNISVKDNLNPALKISEGANDYLSVQTTDGSEKVIFHKNASFAGNAYFGDNDIAYFGASNDGEISADSSGNFILQGNRSTATTYLRGTNVAIGSNGGSGGYPTTIYVTGNSTTSHAELSYGGVKKFETTATGVIVTGDITASGLTLSGDLIVNGTTTTINSTVLSIDDINIILADGNTTDVGANGGGITLKASSDKTLTYNSTTNRWATNIGLTVGGLTEVQQITEILNTKTSATGTVTHDYSTGAIWYHSSISSNFTLNLTNVPTTNDRAITVTLVLNQGGTGYYPNALQIDGAAQTIRWVNNSTPTPSTNKIDAVAFTLIRTGSTWYTLGQLTAYN